MKVKVVILGTVRGRRRNHSKWKLFRCSAPEKQGMMISILSRSARCIIIFRRLCQFRKMRHHIAGFCLMWTTKSTVRSLQSIYGDRVRWIVLVGMETAGWQRSTNILGKYSHGDTLGIYLCHNISPHWYIFIYTYKWFNTVWWTTALLRDSCTKTRKAGYSVNVVQYHGLSHWNVIITLQSEHKHYKVDRVVQDFLLVRRVHPWQWWPGSS